MYSLSNNNSSHSGSDGPSPRTSTEADDMAAGTSARGSVYGGHKPDMDSMPSPGDERESGQLSPALNDLDSSSTCHSGGSHHHSSSHLRDMLLSSHADAAAKARWSGSASSNASNSSKGSGRCADESMALYKFKTNIHQRFTAGQHEQVYPPASNLRYLYAPPTHAQAQEQSSGSKKRKFNMSPTDHPFFDTYRSASSSPPPQQPAPFHPWSKDKQNGLVSTKLESELQKHLETAAVEESEEPGHLFQQHNAKARSAQVG